MEMFYRMKDHFIERKLNKPRKFFCKIQVANKSILESLSQCTLCQLYIKLCCNLTGYGAVEQSMGNRDCTDGDI